MTRTAVGAPDPDPDYRWVDPATAAELLAISVRELYRRIDRGDLPAYRIDKRLRLRRSEVEAVRDRRRGSNGAGP
jgi:excisionase family DNA binding protein